MSVTGDIRVLHVDDDPAVTDITAEFLETEADEFVVETAASGADGLDRLAAEPFDCVVGDYQMPDQSGIELLESIREEYPELPFILYTGRGSEAVASDAIAAGATDYLQKASGTEQYELLANRIRNAVEQYRSHQRAAELDRIRSISAQIKQGLVRADSRAEVEARTCEILSQSDPYLFAWIGELDPDTDRLEPRAWAGVEEGYLENITVTADETETGGGPGGRAVRERSVAVSQNVHEDPEFEPWRADALERGYQAVAAVPLEYEQTLYGILGVYSERPYAFDGDERELLATLGGDVAHAIHSQELQANLRAERQFVEQALNEVHDVFYVVDPDGTLRRWNDRAVATSGYSGEELADIDVTELIADEDQPQVLAAIDEAVRTGESLVEADLLTADGDRIAHEFKGSRLTDTDGNVVGVIGIGRDVSDRKQRKRELEEKNQRLDEFAGVVSHDLRNPLNVAQLRLELARQDCDSEYLDDVAHAHDRMEALIEDVLTVARQGEDIEETTAVDLSELAASCWRTVDTADTSLDVETDQRLHANPSRLKQLLENLFSNAVEHGTQSHREAIEHDAPDEDDSLRITVGALADGFYVADDGLGVPADDHDRLFEAGYSTTPDGTGFGLSIVQAIAEAHGWRLAVTESEAGGARFEVTDVDLA